MTDKFRKAGVLWTGDLENGSGIVSMESKALFEQPFTYRMRFEDEPAQIQKSWSQPRLIIETTNPEWVILSLSFDNGVPDWVDAYMAAHPFVRFIALAPDGSKIKMKWLEVHEQELNGLSLNDLIQILENNPVAA